MESLWRVVFFNREILSVALILGIFLILSTSVLLYYLRPGEVEGFQSIAETMFMSTLMLTGQGSPDLESDTPWYTKGVILLTGVFSIGMFAIPASMLTWGFEAEAQRVASRARQRNKSLKRDPSLTLSSSSSSDGGGQFSDSVDTSDEEYLKIIAGDDDSDEGGAEQSEAEKKVLAELAAIFQGADSDESGTQTKKEFVRLARAMATSGIPLPTQGQALRNTFSHGVVGAEVGSGIQTEVVAGGGSIPALQHHVDRLDRLEAKVEETNHQLARILTLLQGRVGGKISSG
eukprot:gene6552-3204_t